MRTLAPLAAVGLVALQLCACQQAPSEPAAVTVKQSQIEPAPATGSDANTSVPPAASVMAPAPEVKVDPAAGRSTDTMSRAQESAAMPMPGQNNDHSAPLTPAKRASAP
jgi:hypothetical protein